MVCKLMTSIVMAQCRCQYSIGDRASLPFERQRSLYGPLCASVRVGSSAGLIMRREGIDCASGEPSVGSFTDGELRTRLAHVAVL